MMSHKNSTDTEYSGTSVYMTSHMTHELGMDNQKHSFRRFGFGHCFCHTLKESHSCRCVVHKEI